eukprot:scaffold24636_cov31-Tisochrysis_lutea.AAC.2
MSCSCARTSIAICGDRVGGDGGGGGYHPNNGICCVGLKVAVGLGELSRSMQIAQRGGPYEYPQVYRNLQHCNGIGGMPMRRRA